MKLVSMGKPITGFRVVDEDKHVGFISNMQNRDSFTFTPTKRHGYTPKKLRELISAIEEITSRPTMGTFSVDHRGNFMDDVDDMPHQAEQEYEEAFQQKDWVDQMIQDQGLPTED